MNEKKLIELVAVNAQIAKTDAQVAVATVLEHIYSALERGEDFEIADTSVRKLVEETSE